MTNYSLAQMYLQVTEASGSHQKTHTCQVTIVLHRSIATNGFLCTTLHKDSAQKMDVAAYQHYFSINHPP